VTCIFKGAAVDYSWSNPDNFDFHDMYKRKREKNLMIQWQKPKAGYIDYQIIGNFPKWVARINIWMYEEVQIEVSLRSVKTIHHEKYQSIFYVIYEYVPLEDYLANETAILQRAEEDLRGLVFDVLGAEVKPVKEEETAFINVSDEIPF
jgi:hypothetical protein